jgi:hypothetical protein
MTEFSFLVIFLTVYEIARGDKSLTVMTDRKLLNQKNISVSGKQNVPPCYKKISASDK